LRHRLLGLSPADEKLLNPQDDFARASYLWTIANHPKEMLAQPSARLPWNYPKTETTAANDHDPPGLHA
jgi:hypothetical protein